MAIGTTKLNAVNTMLSYVGEAPVNSLADPRPTDVAIAEAVLDEVSRAVQTEGWDFNTECEVTLSPDGSGEIVVPPDTLTIKATSRWATKLTLRGNRLFNIEDRNFTWTNDVEVDLVRELPFEDMPDPAKQYVLRRASREFRERVTDDPRDRAPSEPELRALGRLMNFEHESSDHRMSDAYSVGRITRRQSPMDGHRQ